MTATTSTPKQSKRGGNTWLDRVWQGVAAFAVLALAFREIHDHVLALAPMSYALAGGGLLFLIYLLVAPEFR